MTRRQTCCWTCCTWWPPVLTTWRGTWSPGSWCTDRQAQICSGRSRKLHHPAQCCFAVARGSGFGETLPSHTKVRHLHLVVLWNETIPGSLNEGWQFRQQRWKKIKQHLTLLVISLKDSFVFPLVVFFVGLQPIRGLYLSQPSGH